MGPVPYQQRSIRILYYCTICHWSVLIHLESEVIRNEDLTSIKLFAPLYTYLYVSSLAGQTAIPNWLIFFFENPWVKIDFFSKFKNKYFA